MQPSTIIRAPPAAFSLLYNIIYIAVLLRGQKKGKKGAKSREKASKLRNFIPHLTLQSVGDALALCNQSSPEELELNRLKDSLLRSHALEASILRRRSHLQIAIKVEGDGHGRNQHVWLRGALERRVESAANLHCQVATIVVLRSVDVQVVWQREPNARVGVQHRLVDDGAQIEHAAVEQDLGHPVVEHRKGRQLVVELVRVAKGGRILDGLEALCAAHGLAQPAGELALVHQAALEKRLGLVPTLDRRRLRDQAVRLRKDGWQPQHNVEEGIERRLSVVLPWQRRPLRIRQKRIPTVQQCEADADWAVDADEKLMVRKGSKV